MRLARILRLLAVALIVGAHLLPCATIQAASSVNITVTATPNVSGGITDFTITYISETQLDLSWGYTGDATSIMIRAKYGEYPDDIPDALTEPSDGYLVYVGAGTDVSDTSMDFDENPGPIYYRAWARRADGAWFTSPYEGSEESNVMLLIALLVATLVLIVVAFWLRSTFLQIISGFVSIAFGVFWVVDRTGFYYTILCVGFVAFGFYMLIMSAVDLIRSR